MSETKPLNIFDLVKSINQKNYMFQPEMSGKLYNQMVINKAFGNSKDSILFADLANKMTNITDEMHYDFYYYSLPKAHRFAKWYKKHEAEDIALVMEFYQVSYIKAVDIVSVLTPAQKKEIERQLFKGGEVKNGEDF